MKQTNNQNNLAQPLTEQEHFELIDLTLKIQLSLPSPTIISRYDFLKAKKEAYIKLILKQMRDN